MGEPIAKYFIDQGHRVTGVDGSPKLIALAKQRLPQGDFSVGDMREFSFNEKFDLIVAWNSFFHLSQNDQGNMFVIFSKHLNDNGILLFTSGPDAGEIWSDNGGENLYHASLSPDEYKQILIQNGFELLDYKIADETCRGSTIWLAKYGN